MVLPLGNRDDYIGNGTTADYGYSYKIFNQADLLVTVRNPDTDEETTLVITTDYTVSNVGNSAGGEISLVDSNQAWLDANGYLDNDWVLTVRRRKSIVQETDIRNQGDFYPEAHEDQFDIHTMIDQQQQDEIDRSMKLPETVSADDVDPTLPVPEADTVVGWNATADALENKTPNSSAYLTKATQAEAQAGTEDTHYMTPLKTKDAITQNALSLASQAEAEAGSDNAKYMTPLRSSQAIAALAPVTTSNTATLTNKRVTPRVNTTTSSATPTINTDTTDVFTITALAAAITSFTTNLSGTPTTGQKLIIRIKDDGTARAITWGASFASRGATLPTTTVLSKTTYVGLIWNEVASTWDCIATCTEA